MGGPCRSWLGAPQAKIGVGRPCVLATLRAHGSLLLRARPAGIARALRIAGLRAGEGPDSSGGVGRHAEGGQDERKNAEGDACGWSPPGWLG